MELEGIRMRDFALEHTRKAELDSQLEPIILPNHGPFLAFWRRYVRLTIGEKESRDHLGMPCPLTCITLRIKRYSFQSDPEQLSNAPFWPICVRLQPTHNSVSRWLNSSA